MFKKILKLSPAFLIFLLFLFPLESVNAQGFLTCDGVDCSACNLVDTANIVIKWLFGIIFMIFAVMMMIAGFKLVTSGGNTSALEDAKSKFTNAIVGLIIVMAAWLLVDTIMRGLLKGGTGEIENYGPWADVQCQVQIQPREFIREGSGPDSYSVDSQVNPPAVTSGEYTHQEALDQMAGKNIIVSASGKCSDATKSNCTSLDGVKQNTIQRVVELQQKVGGTLYVTGGTETGHAQGTYSHSEGYKIDFRTTPNLNNYITSNFTKVGDSKWKDEHGNIYYRHGPVDHWDVTITN